MKPVPLDLIGFARIPRADRSRWPGRAYRLYIRGVPGGLGVGYTNAVVTNSGGTWGWAMHDARGRAMGHGTVYSSRHECAARLHWYPDLAPQNVREFLDTATCSACDGDGRIPDRSGGGHHGRCPACEGSGVVAP